MATAEAESEAIDVVVAVADKSEAIVVVVAATIESESLDVADATA